jgi:branched-chain amino acid transport system permease protein
MTTSEGLPDTHGRAEVPGRDAPGAAPSADRPVLGPQRRWDRSRWPAGLGFRALRWLLVLALFIALPFALASSYYLFLVDSALIYATAGIGTIVLFSSIGQLSFASAGLFGVGGFAAAFLSVEWHWDYLLAIVGAAVVALIVGAIIAIPFLRLRGIYLSIGTLAFVLFMQELYTEWGIKRSQDGFDMVPQIFGRVVTGNVDFYWLAVIPLFILAAVVVRVLKGRAGQAFHAVRDSEIAAAASGVRVAAATVGASCLAAVTAGVAGAVYGAFQGYVEPEMFGLGLILIMTTMAVVGGGRPFLGAIIGAAVVTFLPYWLQQVPGFSADAQQGVYGALLVGILLFMPGGLSTLIDRAVAARRRRAAMAPAGLAGAAELTGPAELTPRAGLTVPAELHVPAELTVPAEAPQANGIRPSSPGGREVPADGLSVREVTVAFGGNVAVNKVSLSVAPREILGLIGPNGAGKSTLLNCISGVQRPASGEIWAGPTNLSRLGVSARARLGISRTFQHGELFKGQTVYENVLVGTHASPQDARGRWPAVTDLWTANEDAVRDECLALLDTLSIREYADQPVTSVPLGVQRLTGLARALASHPWLLLLDEPGAGLGQRDCDFLAELIRELRRAAGVSIVLVEHNMPFVMALCDRLVVLDFGVTIAEGTPEEVRHNPEVLAAYLGPSAVDRSQLDG